MTVYRERWAESCKRKDIEMTYIEFYDKTSIVNICSCLTNIPDRVILVGGDRKPIERRKADYRRVFSDRGHNIDFDCRTVNKNSMDDIISKLEEIITLDDEIAVDLTGGDDLMLVAMGIVYERHRTERNIQLHRFNIRSNTIYDCDSDGKTIEKDDLKLSVEENIRIYGGEVVMGAEDGDSGTRPWDITPEFQWELEAMWDACRSNICAWNVQVTILAVAEQYRQADNDRLTTRVSLADVRKHFEENGGVFAMKRSVLNKLQMAGLITFYYDDDTLLVRYKNDQVKRLLSKAGNVLELKVYTELIALEDDAGNPLYDAMNGVVIDWDGNERDGESRVDTYNEVDIVAMKGALPVFISCKNGSTVEMEELYKLYSVSERFGGEYTKRILIATSIDDTKEYFKHFRQRAKDMGITIIDDFAVCDDKERERVLRSLWQRK